jgi:pimeloyl-ACP methyl ester carboxylesterase
VKALGLIPFGLNAFSTELLGRGLAVDPLRTYYVGHSFGAISDAITLAANPRVVRGVLAAPGATAVDVFSSPESHYSANLNALLATATPPILPGTSDYLKTLQVAKWILDPAEPANFVSFVLPGALPNPFQGSALQAFFPAQPARDVLSQFSYKDGSVPNAQNAYYAGRLGYPVPPVGSAATDSNVQWYFDPVGPGTVSHSNILDFKIDSLTRQAQSNAAQFLVTPVGQAATVTP